ncbi:o-succinylbenzoate--CoA ligase [Haladaptatus sp. GCM10025707]|uniref:o-succinylbenzoate--CoA ligase n=1 Tax=unclassified Haladaptatus TaxID=2622732 RepID=UPI0023E7DCF2|nr:MULTISPECIES: o-succinylbenzoate--CoA ligase [unclassified Haladaptatus]
MYDWLRHRASVSADATALVAADSEATWTYRELDDAVSRTAAHLVGAGVGRGDHVGTLLDTSVEFVKLIHATARLGAVLVPLNTRLTSAELRPQIERADLTALVCSVATAEKAVSACESADTTLLSVSRRDAGSVPELAAQPLGSVTPATWDEDDPQVIMFTSGTTGEPKAVVLTHGNLAASAEASAYRLGTLPGDRWLVCLSLYHMGGLAPILRATRYGSTVVFVSEFDPERVGRAIEEYEPTGISLVPVMLSRLLDAGVSFNSFRFVLLGGAPARDDLIARCEREGVPVYPTYGMTETASQIATATPTEAFAHQGTVGKPLLFTEVTVVGVDGEPVEHGEHGELVVRGPTVMKEYYGDYEATVEAFSEYGLHTGDVGYRDEAGRLWVLNRRSDRIISGGENVDPGEVAAVLLSHPAVADVAVVGVPDEEWGERVGALVVPEPDATPSRDELDAHCREFLAGFKCPRLVAFAAELPRTASGTVAREAVRDLLRATE